MKRSEFFRVCGTGICALFLAQRGVLPGTEAEAEAEIAVEAEEITLPTIFAASACVARFPLKIEWLEDDLAPRIKEDTRFMDVARLATPRLP